VLEIISVAEPHPTSDWLPILKGSNRPEWQIPVVVAPQRESTYG